MLESLTGYRAQAPTPSHASLVDLFENSVDTAEALVGHLDSRASWELHVSDRVPALYGIVERCLEHRRNRRPDIVDLLPDLDEAKRGAAALPSAEESAARLECVICLRGDAEVRGWVVLKPCQHLCVCQECSDGLLKRGDPCPKCRKAISGCDQLYL